AAAAYNRGLLALLRGDLLGAAESAQSFPKESSSQRTGFYSHVERVLRGSGLSLSPTVELELNGRAHANLAPRDVGIAAVAAARARGHAPPSLDALSQLLK